MQGEIHSHVREPVEAILKVALVRAESPRSGSCLRRPPSPRRAPVTRRDSCLCEMNGHAGNRSRNSHLPETALSAVHPLFTGRVKPDTFSGPMQAHQDKAKSNDAVLLVTANSPKEFLKLWQNPRGFLALLQVRAEMPNRKRSKEEG